jgi:hypothetical protein
MSIQLPHTKPPPPLAVRLPDLPSVPDPWKGATYVLRSLLSHGDDNPKLRKSNLANTPYQSYGLALAPARESGHQFCSSSTRSCRASCLYRQGQARIDTTIVACRIAKSVAWKVHRAWFQRRLVYELTRITERADRQGFRVALRLNLTSDILWEREFPELFPMFRDVVYYDYTKHYPRMMRFLNDELPPNYSLTFSRSEDNDPRCRTVLEAGGTVAVVFRDQHFPNRFLGHQVVNGDEHDLRFLDPEGVVIGLSAKGTAKHDESGFVVETSSARRTLPLLT